MTKYELEEIKEEYDLLIAKEQAKQFIDKLVTIDEVNSIKDYAEDVYKNSITDTWGFLYGMRDNIHDMTENLAKVQDYQKLQYFNTLMYGILLEHKPNIVDGLYTMSKPMKDILLEHLLKGGAA